MTPVTWKVCLGSLAGGNHATYTVILRACGNEATTWWDGCRAGMAAIDVVFIPSCAPEGEMCMLKPVVTLEVLIYIVFLCPCGNESRYLLSMSTSSILSEFIPKNWKWYTDILKYFNNRVNFVCWSHPSSSSICALIKAFRNKWLNRGAELSKTQTKWRKEMVA